MSQTPQEPQGVKPGKSFKADEVHALAKERLLRVVEDEGKMRRSALDNVKFAHGDQWDAESTQKRLSDKRPMLTINRLQTFVRQVVGDMRQNRPQAKVRGVSSSSDADIANVIEGLIRHIDQQSTAKIAYDTAAKSQVEASFGFWRILTRYKSHDSFDQEIYIQRVKNQFSVYFDHSGNEWDYSDARYCFITDKIPEAEFERRWPNKKAGAPGKLARGEGDNHDKNITEKMVDVTEYFFAEYEDDILCLYSDGTRYLKSELKDHTIPEGVEKVQDRKTKVRRIYWCTFCEDRILDDVRKIAGKYIPVVPVWGREYFYDNERHLEGLIDHSKDSQRMFNYWRSAATEVVAQQPKAPYMLTPKMIQGHSADWQKVNVETLPYLLFNETKMGFPKRIDPYPIPAAIVHESRSAIDDMKATTGIFDAGLGAKGNEVSGTAILARQKESDTSTFDLVDNYHLAMMYSAKIIVDLIPQIYNSKRIVRILSEDGKEKMVPINTKNPDYVAEKSAKMFLNDLSVGEYDVYIDIGPSFMTKRIEAANAMMELTRHNPKLGELTADRMIENMDWPGAKAMALRIRKTLPPHLLTQDEREEISEEFAKAKGMDMGPQAQQQAMQQQQAEADRMAQELKMKQEIELQRLKLEHEQKMIELDTLNKQKEIELKELKIVSEQNKSEEDIVKIVGKTLEQFLGSPAEGQESKNYGGSK